MTARLVRLLRRSTIRSSCSHRTGVDYYQSVKLLLFFLKQNPHPFGFGIHTHTLLIGLTNHTLYITYIIWYFMMKKLEDFMKLILKYL